MTNQEALARAVARSEGIEVLTGGFGSRPSQRWLPVYLLGVISGALVVWLL